jgi:serine/threonine protein kinase/WD40 repeat protein/tetratricopeptide (TPR) repeat protein
MSVSQPDLDAVGRVAESFLARYRRGERPSLSEYTARYPELAEQIRDLFPALVVMEELGSVAGPRTRAPVRTVLNEAPKYLGDYRILREVGRGGMGVVYEAVQESLGRHVALKVLTFHNLLPPTLLERFRREARAAAGLHHTNIVPVYGVGEHEGVHYYAMQFIPGQALDEVLKEVKRLRGPKGSVSPENSGPGTDLSQSLAEGLLSGRFAPAGAASPPTEALAAPAESSSAPPTTSDPPTAATVAGPASGTALRARTEAQYFRSVAGMVAQVAAAVDYAHKQGILHRDLKPANLLLDARGTVWITDFGLAKAEGTDELTRTGDIVGTLRYMAPERFQGSSDPRSDVYSLGTTLYELLTLQPPFADSSRAWLVGRIAHEEPPRPRQVDRSIPRDLETIVLKAIAKEPGRRYQTAAELAEDLGRFLAGEPVRARRIGLWERAVKWIKRRPAVAALLAVSAAAALTLLVVTLVHNAQLSGALQDAQNNLAKAQRAERGMLRQLAITQVREAQARRNSGLVGRRFESLEALKTAAAHFRALGQFDEERALELRNEAIACLLLADLKPAREPAPDPGWSRPCAFDPTLQFYVVHSTVEGQPAKGAAGSGNLSVRRVADDQEMVHLPGFGVRAVAARFSPDGRYLAVHYEQKKRYCYVWDLGRRVAILKVPLDEYESNPAFSPNSQLVALALPDYSIRIYELPSGAVWKDLPPGPPVRLLQFHPDGRRLAVVTGNTVQIRDRIDGKELATFDHPAKVHSLAWRADGMVFATGCFDSDIYLWSVEDSGRLLRIVKGHLGSVFSVAFSRGGDLLVSDGWDSTSRLWDPRTGQQLLFMRGGMSFELGPNGEGLDFAWQEAGGPACRTFHGQKYLRHVALSPGGRLLASVGSAGVELWDLAANREGDKHLATLPVGPSLAVHFDPKGSLITDSKHAGLQRWPVTPDASTGGLRIGPPESLGLSARAPLFGNNPDFALSADGRTVVHCPDHDHALVYDLDNPRRKLHLEGPDLRHAAFSPDGRWLATGNWQGHGAKVWNAHTGEVVCDLDLYEPDEGAAWPAFSPDGKWLVVGTYGEHRFWEVGSWQKRHGFARANGTKAVARVAFTRDGKLLAVLHDVSEVRLLDPETGREFARLPAAGCPQCFSADGSQLVTGGVRGGVFQVWDLRLIRRQLKELGLDWDLPAYPPPPEPAKPLRVQVLAAEPPAPAAGPDAQAYLERGLLFVQLREYVQAAKDFRRANELDPQGIPWGEVVRAYDRVIERHRDDPELYHQRGHAHAHLGQWEKSVRDHSRAISLAPQRPDLLACRGRTYLRAGQKDRAAEDFRKAGGQKADLANQLAWELVTAPDPSQREPALALELAQQAVRQAPGEAPYRITLGVASYRAREWQAAVQALDEAEKLAPGKYLGVNAFFLAMCHQQLGDTARARDDYDRAVRWCQENQGKLSGTQQQELRAFRLEVEALLRQGG